MLKKKTTWVGILLIAAGLVKGLFDGDWGAAVQEILLGGAVITGRQAVEKVDKKLKEVAIR